MSQDQLVTCMFRDVIKTWLKFPRFFLNMTSSMQRMLHFYKIQVETCSLLFNKAHLCVATTHGLQRFLLAHSSVPVGDDWRFFCEAL